MMIHMDNPLTHWIRISNGWLHRYTTNGSRSESSYCRNVTFSIATTMND
jgi:hypothetical protein